MEMKKRFIIFALLLSIVSGLNSKKTYFNKLIVYEDSDVEIEWNAYYEKRISI